MHLSNLRHIRLLSFLTQRELAEKAGTTQATIARLEAGTTKARPTTAQPLPAGALGVDPRQLINDDSEGAKK